MKLYSEKEFSELTQSIQSHQYHIPSDREDADLRQHSFAVAKVANEKFYILNGTRVYTLVFNALRKKFPHIDEYSLKLFCERVPAYLERPCIMLEHIPNKEDRDYFIQKVLIPTEQEVLDLSITRATNIGIMSSVIEAIFDEPEDLEYFENFKKTVLRLHSNQQRQKNDVTRILNAKNVRKIVHDFCITLIQEASLL